jgi:hypothetical protein
MSSVAPPTAVETGITPIRVTAPGRMVSPIPRDRGAGGADLPGMIRSDPVTGVDDEIVVSPTPDTASDPPDIPGRKALRLEEFFIHPDAVGRDRIPEGSEDGRRVIRSPGTVWIPPPRRPRYQRPLFLAAAVTILLLIGGAFYFVDGNSGRTSSSNVIPVQARSAPEHAVFDVGNRRNLNSCLGEPLYLIRNRDDVGRLNLGPSGDHAQAGITRRSSRTFAGK